MESIMKNMGCGMGASSKRVGRAASLGAAGLALWITGCGPSEDGIMEGVILEEEDITLLVHPGDDGGLVVHAGDEEDSLAEAAQALGAVGFSTYVGGPGYDFAQGVATDGAGNVYVAGTMPVAGKDKDVFVAKYSPLGSLVYLTSFGGTGTEETRDIAVDTAGNVVVVAKTASYGPAQTILVAKLNTAGNALLYYSRFGGSGYEFPQGIALDPGGNVYVAGETMSTDFPVTPGALQPVRRAGLEAFVTKVNASGTALVYSTYLGGDGSDGARDIAVDAFGYAYVVGDTTPAAGVAFPTTPAAFQKLPQGASDVFVTELTPSGSALYYSTLLGGTANEYAGKIAVDGAFQAHVTGWAQSANFPTTPGAARTWKGGPSAFEVFVTKLNEPGSGLVYSTYVAASGDWPAGIAVGSSGKAFVVGTTFSSAFPVKPGAFQPTFGGSADGFLLELSASGSAVTYATYLGGNAVDQALGVAVDKNGHACVAGSTDSVSFPVFGAAQPVPGGGGDGFVVKIKGP
jgi:hypothetical protein